MAAKSKKLGAPHDSFCLNPSSTISYPVTVACYTKWCWPLALLLCAAPAKPWRAAAEERKTA